MSDDQNIFSYLEKIYFFSDINEKEKPPVSPVPNETRELARRSMADFQKNVEKAKIKAKNTGNDVELDGSRLSGVKSGDIWIIDKNGIKERIFEKNEQLLEGILQRRTERVADPRKGLNFKLLLKVLSFAQWAPNATNEQPTKVMVYRKDHPSMEKIGSLMHRALYERIIPNINIRNYIVNKKRENPDFLPNISLKELTEMDDHIFNGHQFEEMPAPLHEFPQTTDKLLERDKISFKEGKYYNKKDQKKVSEYKIKDLINNDKIFASGMGKFFLKFKNTHPYLIVVFRKWHYTSLMTETLNKYGIDLPDVGEEYIDAGFYSDHLCLAARGLGLSGVIKTGPLDLAKDELTELFIHDLKKQIQLYQSILNSDKGLPAKRKRILQMEIHNQKLLWNGLKYGLEAMRCKEQNQPVREQLRVALKRGEVYVPAVFFQLGYPLSDPGERVMDPRQGRSSLDKMLAFMI
jgi:nitroreductase